MSNSTNSLTTQIHCNPSNIRVALTIVWTGINHCDSKCCQGHYLCEHDEKQAKCVDAVSCLERSVLRWSGECLKALLFIPSVNRTREDWCFRFDVQQTRSPRLTHFPLTHQLHKIHNTKSSILNSLSQRTFTHEWNKILPQCAIRFSSHYLQHA